MVADIGPEAVVAADIGLEVVVAADTVPEVEVVRTVPEVVEDIVPVMFAAAGTVLELVVAADAVLAVSQRLGSDMVLAVYNPQQISFAQRTLTESSISLAVLPIKKKTYLWVLWLLKRRYRSCCRRVRWRRREWWKIRHERKGE